MSDKLMASLGGLGDFGAAIALALGLLVVFNYIYTLLTPHDEIALIKENNQAAAITNVGAILGFSIALYSALANSVDIVDLLVWGIIAAAVQLLAFFLMRVTVYPKLVERISAGETAAAIKMAGVSIAVGILNAGCMTA